MNHPPPHERYPWSPQWSVTRYRRMVEARILTEEDRVELVDGYLLLRSPPGPEHGRTVERITAALVAPPDWRIRVQLPVLFADSHVEPDVALVSEDPDGYALGHPTGIDVHLAIDVASTPPSHHRTDRLRIYARAGIPDFWIVNLDDRRIEVHTQPSGPCDSPAYASVVNYAPGDAVPLVLDGVTVATIPVSDLLP